MLSQNVLWNQLTQSHVQSLLMVLLDLYSWNCHQTVLSIETQVSVLELKSHFWLPELESIDIHRWEARE